MNRPRPTMLAAAIVIAVLLLAIAMIPGGKPNTQTSRFSVPVFGGYTNAPDGVPLAVFHMRGERSQVSPEYLVEILDGSASRATRAETNRHSSLKGEFLIPIPADASKWRVGMQVGRSRGEQLAYKLFSTRTGQALQPFLPKFVTSDPAGVYWSDWIEPDKQ